MSRYRLIHKHLVYILKYDWESNKGPIMSQGKYIDSACKKLFDKYGKKVYLKVLFANLKLENEIENLHSTSIYTFYQIPILNPFYLPMDPIFTFQFLERCWHTKNISILTIFRSFIFSSKLIYPNQTLTLYHLQNKTDLGRLIPSEFIKK